eukprot:COSAG02_NODE_1853_length_10660_cov_23.960231_5_plen_122_part_00
MQQFDYRSFGPNLNGECLGVTLFHWLISAPDPSTKFPRTDWAQLFNSTVYPTMRNRHSAETTQVTFSRLLWEFSVSRIETRTECTVKLQNLLIALLDQPCAGPVFVTELCVLRTFGVSTFH